MAHFNPARPLAFALMVAALPAASQTVTTNPLVIRAPDSSSSLTILPSDCNQTFTATYAYQTSVGNLCNSLKIWATTSDCGAAPASGFITTIAPVTLLTTPTGNFTFKVIDLPGFKGTDTDGGVLCGAEGRTIPQKICGEIDYSTYQCGVSTSLQLTATPLDLVYDTQPPTAPGIGDPVPQDSAASIPFTADADTDRVRAEYKGPTDSTWVSSTEVAVAAGKVRISGLTNGTEYTVHLLATDLGGNVSVPSEERTVTPIHTIGFWGAYRGAGGADMGGCSAAGGWPFALAALTWLRRRRS